jgi:hypothetical protein
VAGRRLRIDAPPGDHIFVDFEESGGIYRIVFSPEPKPKSKKASWFKGLSRAKRGKSDD